MDIKEREQIIEDMRQRLSEAVNKATGDLRSPEVYEISRKLDHMINEYMILRKLD